MQIRKTYKNIKPDLLFDELKDLLEKQGLKSDKAKMENYTLPDDSSTFISRGTITFKNLSENGEETRSGIRGHVIGSTKGETKLMIDINPKYLGEDKLKAFQSDLEFMLGTYEIK